jgi:hypothetical protein
MLTFGQQPDKQIAQIEKSVTHLLVATKQLLETLTQWSRKQAQEEEVSDVYVRLGYEFNLACRAFNSIGVDTSDLGPVPDLLRSILEDTLSQPASPQSLDTYLPRIRDIIINLLHGLKRKQSKLRNRSNKDGSSSRSAAPSRQMSGTSLGSNDTGLTQMLEDVPNQAQSTMRDQKNDDMQGLEDQGSLPARNPSAPANTDRFSVSNRQSLQRDINRSVTLSDSSSSLALQCRICPSYPHTRIRSRTRFGQKMLFHILHLHLQSSRMLSPRFKEVASWNGGHRGDFLHTKYRNILAHHLMGFLLYPLLSIRRFRIEVNTFGSQEK